jgi:hypothetical protein
MKNLIFLLTILLTISQSFAQRTEFIWDTITFEEPYEYLVIDTSIQNIWQIGVPNKIILDSAYSNYNALLTDTLNFYPLNNYSYFDLKIGEFNYKYYYSYDIFIEIKHKFNTDTLKDGGYITVSYDEGQTWVNIIDDTSGWWAITPGNDSYSGENLYTKNDTLFNGDFGFSGNSTEWLTTWFTWHNYPVKKKKDFLGDTMIVRFNFLSDNIENNKEGWMIDDIKLYSVDLGGGTNNIKPLEFKILPNPMNEIAILKLNDYIELELSIFNIQGQLVSQQNYFNNQSITINRGIFNSGIYIIKIRNEENSIGIKKLIIQ